MSELYPIVSLKEWCKKYDLQVQRSKCDHCKAPMATTRPFVNRDGFGLVNPPCRCGNGSHLYTMQLRSGKYKNMIDDLVWGTP